MEQVSVKSVGDTSSLAKVLWYYNIVRDTHTIRQKITCPFHKNDVNPSLMVDLSNNSWFCFGCQLGGDTIKFVELIENKHNSLNSLQVYRKYSKILKSDKCSKIKINQMLVKSPQKPSRQLYNESYDYYHGLKTIDWVNDTDEEIMRPLSYMEKRGYSPETLNMVHAKITYNSNYELIFPMMDNGKFRGWVSRTMKKDIEAKRKYLYNEGFSRATTLVGDYGKDKYVIVVEGYMDMLRFIEYGIYESVVAILGWKMSVQQEAKVRDAGIQVVISCLDNDECGKKGTMYLKSVFGPQNVIRWKYLKGIKDPGEADKIQFCKMYNKTINEYYKLYGKKVEKKWLD